MKLFYLYTLNQVSQVKTQQTHTLFNINWDWIPKRRRSREAGKQRHRITAKKVCFSRSISFLPLFFSSLSLLLFFVRHTAPFLYITCLIITPPQSSPHHNTPHHTTLQLLLVDQAYFTYKLHFIRTNNFSSYKTGWLVGYHGISFNFNPLEFAALGRATFFLFLLLLLCFLFIYLLIFITTEICSVKKKTKKNTKNTSMCCCSCWWCLQTSSLRIPKNYESTGFHARSCKFYRV